jgi:hypothetical protein
MMFFTQLVLKLYRIQRIFANAHGLPVALLIIADDSILALGSYMTDDAGVILATDADVIAAGSRPQPRRMLMTWGDAPSFTS